MREIVQIDISGRDRPGITMGLTQVLARYDVTMLDMGQSVIHNTLALGLLVEMPEESAGCPVFRELLFKAHELGLDLRFTPIDPDAYEGWVGERGQPRHIVTLLGREIDAGHIARLAAVVQEHGLNIEQITRPSGRISRRDSRPGQHASVELSLRGPVMDVSTLHRAVLALGSAMDVDIAIQEDDIFRRNRRLVCFDMDSTLIQTEVIDELAVAAGVGERVAAITESAMRGELDFAESFRRRMALLQGLDESVLAEIAAGLPITPGAERLIGTLKQLGYRVAILSGLIVIPARESRLPPLVRTADPTG